MPEWVYISAMVRDLQTRYYELMFDERQESNCNKSLIIYANIFIYELSSTSKKNKQPRGNND